MKYIISSFDIILVVALILIINIIYVSDNFPYYGKLIDKLSNKEEGLSGKVFAVDENTVFIRNFTYIGKNSRGL